jgi:hypothetical protein
MKRFRELTKEEQDAEWKRMKLEHYEAEKAERKLKKERDAAHSLLEWYKTPQTSTDSNLNYLEFSHPGGYLPLVEDAKAKTFHDFDRRMIHEHQFRGSPWDQKAIQQINIPRYTQYNRVNPIPSSHEAFARQTPLLYKAMEETQNAQGNWHMEQKEEQYYMINALKGLRNRELGRKWNPVSVPPRFRPQEEYSNYPKNYKDNPMMHEYLTDQLNFHLTAFEPDYDEESDR